jgi:hypothetical protein
MQAMAKRQKFTQESAMAMRVYEDALRDPSAYNVEVARTMALNSLAADGLTLDGDEIIPIGGPADAAPVAVAQPAPLRARMSWSQSLRLAIPVFLTMIPLAVIVLLIAGVFILVTAAGSAFSTAPTTLGQVVGIFLVTLLVAYVVIMFAQGALLMLLASSHTGGALGFWQCVLVSLPAMIATIALVTLVHSRLGYVVDLPLLVVGLRLIARPVQVEQVG